MFKLVFVIKCLFILIAPNPLQGLQSYPLAAYQQNYVNHDQPIMTQMFDPYTQLLQQNTWPSYQNIPVTYQDTSKGYYDNLVLNSVPNTFVDPNVRIYDQNGIDITQYITGPRDMIPNVISNYVTIPQDYLKYKCADNERQLYFPSELTVPIQGHFGTINDIDPSINYNCPIQNVERTNKNNNKKRKLKQSKRIRNREDSQNKIVKCKPSSKNFKRKNNVSDKKNCEFDERENYKCTQEANDVNNANNLDKKEKTSHKSKSKSTTDEIVHIKDEKCHGNILNDDIFECLDINENCMDLESRRARNNYNINPVETFQQFPNMPKEFNSNIASYLNSFMPNQNFNTDLFTANGNFPYNFDYMNQMPQNSNSNANGSEKRRRNRRRKKKQKNNRTSTNNNATTSTNNDGRTSKNNNENSNKNKQIEDKCNKVVELLPNKPVEIKIKTKPMPTASVQCDIVSEKDFKVNMEAEIIPDKVDEDPIEVNLESTSIIIDEDDKDLHLMPVSQEYPVNVYDNDIFDDYYPDFTSDNFYLSKEDQDYNFHDRHYYSADNKPGISRERRKYEANVKQNHKKNRIDTSIDDDIFDKNIKEDKKISSIEEVKFKTPPGLDFPDFKTEMINKDKYSPRYDINYQSNKRQNDKASSFSKVKSTETKSEKNVDNSVETVFARSKVAKYGVPEYEEKSNKNVDESNTDRHTNDEKTTIVLAKSLIYPVGYK